MVQAITLKKDGPLYTMGDLIVAPVSMDLLASAYLTMKMDGTLSVLFYESDPGIPKFLATYSDPNAITYGCYLKSGDQTTLVGIGHISAAIGRGDGSKKSELSCAFFAGYQRRDITFPLSQMMLEQTFDRYDIDVLFGTTPEKNRAMLMFMKNLGFGHTAEPVPYFTTWKGEVCGVYISWITREMWEELSPFKDHDSQ